MSDVLDRIVRTREEAHAAATAAYAIAKCAIDNGRSARLVASEHDKDRSLQANRWYWGVCLREISEQARIDGKRYAAEAWHELAKRMFLGFEIKKVRVAGKPKAVVIRRLKSTTDLKVKAFSEYLEKLQAFAVTDLGVQFSVRDWQDYTE